MRKAFASYLRTHRRRSGLTQAEVAHVLGLKNRESVSRHERLDRRPSLEAMFAYQILFDTPPHELCPGLYKSVEKLTLRRIRTLAGRLPDRTRDRLARRKHDVLSEAINRAGSRRTNS